MYPQEKELACTKCKSRVAFTKPDYSKPSEKHFCYNGSAKEAQWSVMFPLKERTGSELCYVCEKIELGLMELTETRGSNSAIILTY